MSAPASRRLVLALWAFSILMVVGETVFMALNGRTGVTDNDLVNYALNLPLFVMPSIGALVARRLPGNPVGWILLGSGVLVTFAAFCEGWALYGLFTEPGALPAAREAASISANIFIPPLVIMPVLLFLLFPDGRLPGRRWRAVVVMAVAAGTGAALNAGLFAETLDDAPFAGVPNELHIPVPHALYQGVGYTGWPLIALSIVLAATGLIVRLRRSRGTERQQLKWMAAAGALFAVTTTASVTLHFANLESIGGITLILGYAAIPLAAGAAILRHRIYDVDLVINRALVYGALTALLAGTYVGLALLLGLALGPLTSGSDLAIALSTLGVAALVRPVRARMQGLVDRRFYRRKYDAERTLEQFAARLRTETDLATLQAELAAAVREAVQPAHVSVWLREGSG